VDLDADRDLDAIPITSGWTEPQPRFAWLNDGVVSSFVWAGFAETRLSQRRRRRATLK
jgi:hypothetical protein